MRRLVRALRKEIDLRRGALASVTLELTYLCNLRCIMCGVWEKGLERAESELSSEEILRVLREARALGAHELSLVGAEPTMRKDLVTIVRDAKELGFTVHVVTNGTLVKDALASELVSADLDRVTVSLDGSAAVHDKMRGRPGVFESAARGVENLLAARKAAGSSLPAVGVHCTICSENADLLDEMADVARTLGVDSLSYQLLTEITEDEVSSSRVDGKVVSGWEHVAGGVSLLPSPRQAESVRRFARARCDEWFSPTLLLLGSMTPEAISAGRFPMRRCAVVRRELIVDPYGKVDPCSHIVEYPLGDVRKQSVGEIWSGEPHRRLLRALSKRLLPVCAKCCQHASNLTFMQKSTLRLQSRFWKSA